MPAAMIWLTVLAASSTVEDGGQSHIGLWIGREADPDLGDHGQRAFAAAQHAGQVQFGRIVHGPKLHEGTIAQHDFQTEHVVHRHAVLQRMRSAGVGGHIAADRGGTWLDGSGAKW